MEENLQGDIWTVKAVWKCTMCAEGWAKSLHFNDKNDFMDHLNRQCHICNTEFTNNDSLKHHFSVEHLPVEREGHLTCRLCARNFFTQAAYDSHGKKHKLFGCIGCASGFQDFKDYCSHANLCQPCWKKMILTTVNYECFGCGYLFKTSKVLVEHFLTCEKAIAIDMSLSCLDRNKVVNGLIYTRSTFHRKQSDEKSGSLFVKFHKDSIGLENKTISIFSMDKKSGQVKPVALNIVPEKGKVQTKDSGENLELDLDLEVLDEKTLTDDDECKIIDDKPVSEKIQGYQRPTINWKNPVSFGNASVTITVADEKSETTKYHEDQSQKITENNPVSIVKIGNPLVTTSNTMPVSNNDGPTQSIIEKNSMSIVKMGTSPVVTCPKTLPQSSGLQLQSSDVEKPVTIEQKPPSTTTSSATLTITSIPSAVKNLGHLGHEIKIINQKSVLIKRVEAAVPSSNFLPISQPRLPIPVTTKQSDTMTFHGPIRFPIPAPTTSPSNNTLANQGSIELLTPATAQNGSLFQSTSTLLNQGAIQNLIPTTLQNDAFTKPSMVTTFGDFRKRRGTPMEEMLEAPKNAFGLEKAMKNPLYYKNPCRPFIPIKKSKPPEPIKADKDELKIGRFVKLDSSARLSSSKPDPLPRSRHVPILDEDLPQEDTEERIHIEVDVNNIRDLASYATLMNATADENDPLMQNVSTVTDAKSLKDPLEAKDEPEPKGTEDQIKVSDLPKSTKDPLEIQNEPEPKSTEDQIEVFDWPKSTNDHVDVVKEPGKARDPELKKRVQSILLGESDDEEAGGDINLMITDVTSLSDPVLEEFADLIEKKQDLVEKLRDNIVTHTIKEEPIEKRDVELKQVVLLERLKQTRNQKTFHVFQCELPEIILPFDVIDAQPKFLDKPTEGPRVIRTKLIKRSDDQDMVHGFKDQNWVISQVPSKFVEDVPIVCEDASNGEIHQTWCKMSSS